MEKNQKGHKQLSQYGINETKQRLKITKLLSRIMLKEQYIDLKSRHQNWKKKISKVKNSTIRA